MSKIKRPSAWHLPDSSREVLWLLSFLGAGLLLRLLLLPSQGHVTDIGSFESWTLSLNKFGVKAFYSQAGFVDYPPGYMLVLWCVGQLFKLFFVSNDYYHLLFLVKMPAILSDIGIGLLIYLIVRRQWPMAAALSAVAVFVLNPASWFVSAYWGQADSVAAVFLVLAVYLALKDRFEWAWAALAFAVLIKPQPLVIAPLLVFWQLRRQAPWRLLLAPLIGAAVAWLGSLPFAPAFDPAAVLTWLYQRYQTGISVYQVNSANAFNLYSIVRDMWQPDTEIVRVCLPPGLGGGCVPGLGFPQYDWGIAIFVFLLVALTWRQWRTTGDDVESGQREYRFVAACFIALLGYFMLTTRVHERYMFSALAIAPLLWNRGALPKAALTLLSISFMFNLTYALQYLYHPSADLNPFEVHGLSLINVLVLFAVAGSYLVDEMDASVADFFARFKSSISATGGAYRSAFEGLIGWTRPDYLIVAGWMIVAALLLFTGLRYPPDRYFDEIYYARAAQEYLQGKDLYEWTHPPFIKLLYAAGAWFFNTFFKAGDPVGARMTSAVCGVLTIPLLYGFAKRLFSSTPAAFLTIVLLVTGDYWYVQSRIAQPEIFMGFLALLTIYCAYRLIIASQIVARPRPVSYPGVKGIVASIAAFFGVLAYVKIQAIVSGKPATEAASIVPYLVAVFAFGGVAVWLFARNKELGKTRDAVVFGDGVVLDRDGAMLPSGERVSLKGAAIADAGTQVTWTSDGAEITTADGMLRRKRDGNIEGVWRGTPVRDSQPWTFWFVLTALSVAAMIASKWYGLFDLAGLWFVAGLITAQQFLPAAWDKATSAGARFIWGNPFAARLPLLVSGATFAVLVIYVASYLPNFRHAVWEAYEPSLGGHQGFAALIWLQSIMWHYHHDLVATHPYASAWWSWPFEIRPVSYFWNDHPVTPNPNHLVSEIIALPNPFVWLAGVITVPVAAILAWRERHKGMLFVSVMYVWQWVPWATSTRIDFQYNFYSNTALMCLCTAFVMQRIWQAALKDDSSRRLAINVALGAYIALCLWGFIYFLPILNGAPIPWTSWDHKMWFHYGQPNWFGWI
ncbi:MAG TPA: phospholipid carrier-dependent glycosyltransferase [Candidatus Eremiobacteraceae bacterium]|nr:phospholipid carrier-dependent glycosyltransferase [Candidatus Eremiobacteraceae bacterium]